MRLHPVLNFALSVSVMASLLTTTVATTAQSPVPYLSAFAEPLPVDRGAAAVWQSLKKLQTRASIMMVVAHPDDEDGGMLTYESRRQGVDTTLLTLNRGEGGQNVMSSDYWDQLGLVRTQELLAAGDAYGVHQYWTRVADFGFSKSIDEALKTWGHDRVLYDCVRVVRMTRPLVVTSVFAGNVSDGHGHHQVSGLMAQEVYKAAGDPNVFPDQIKAGLRPWSPLKVYARVPLARVTEKGIYDYATGHWEPVRFRNYVTGTWIEGIPSATLEVPEGEYSALLARSYLTLAREGLAQQKSQNGGIAAPPPQQFNSPYHLYASRVTTTLPEHESDFFEGIDISLAGIATYAPESEQKVWRDKLTELNATVTQAAAAFDGTDPAKTAPALAEGLAQTKQLLADVAASNLPEDAKYNMQHELEIKRVQFNDALNQALGVTLVATVVNPNEPLRAGPMGIMSNQAGTFQTVIPGQSFSLNVHLANQGNQAINIVKTQVVSHAGSDWAITVKNSIDGIVKAREAKDLMVSATVAADAAPTAPYFTRPDLEQSYYDILNSKFLNLPTMPYPLSAEVTYSYNGVEAQTSEVVQTIHRFTGPGPLQEPLLVAPAISLTVSPEAGIVPIGNATLRLQVTVHNNVKGPAKGKVRLDLPAGWTSQPEVAEFATAMDGDERIVSFQVIPKSVETKPYSIKAVAEYDGKQYTQGFNDVGYVGLRPYPYYRNAAMRTTGVDVKVAPGLKVGYIMGTGDDVPSSLQDVDVHVVQLSPKDVETADLSSYDAIVLGIRAYAARPELKTSNSRLLEYVKNGGVVIVQYQTGEYDHNYGPYSLSLSGDPEKVVEEDSKVTLLAPNDPLLNWPNKITERDFSGWIEERGHGFIRTWDPHYIALTEMHDVNQEPQKGGLLYAHYGSGAYVYMSYAFFRQLPEGVPGSFRIMSNLISLRKNPSFRSSIGEIK
jgi:LmbE family N-acetylglucosaminyl deacetylase